MKVTFSEIKTKFKQYLQLYKSLLEDTRLPTISRICLTLAIGYAFLPFDLIPDFIPILGHLDDLIIIPGLIYLAIKFVPKEIYDEHKEKVFDSR